MRKSNSYIFALVTAVLLVAGSADVRAQRRQKSEGGVLEYIVEGKDTFFVDQLRASKVYPKLARQKGKDWREYYRLVHNFSKTYPYALVARELLLDVDSTILADNFKKGKKEKFLKKKQDELFNVFETPLKNLTVNQGRLLMKLIDREVGKSSYSIIKEYRNGMAAGFWQGMARLFGSNLKKHYDPEGEDANVEDLVQKWEEGSFSDFYYSLFWQYPPEVVIPEKYLKKVTDPANPSK